MATATVKTGVVGVHLVLDKDEVQVLWDILANVSGAANSSGVGPRVKKFYGILNALEDALESTDLDLDNTRTRTKGSIVVIDV